MIHKKRKKIRKKERKKEKRKKKRNKGIFLVFKEDWIKAFRSETVFYLSFFHWGQSYKTFYTFVV